MSDALDWTDGGDALHFQHCPGCQHRWYFAREFCPSCGHTGPITQVSAAQGVVVATTTVHRAPNEAFRSIVPYQMVLVDMAEGFRVMGHAEMGLAIGDPVQCEIRERAGRMLPCFVREDAARRLPL
jgi:uncharacterized OB-fold protein